MASAKVRPSALGAAFYRLELRQRLLQPLAVDLHPFAAHQRQPIGALQDFADLLSAKRFVIERHLKAGNPGAPRPQRRTAPNRQPMP